MIAAGHARTQGRQGLLHFIAKARKPQPNQDARRAASAAAATQFAARTSCEQRMVLLMVNEAARCLEEEIVESAGDVDFAMVMGTGFAPFRGGPLRYADSLGVAQGRRRTRAARRTAPGRISRPARCSREMAQIRETFL